MLQVINLFEKAHFWGEVFLTSTVKINNRRLRLNDIVVPCLGKESDDGSVQQRLIG
jgi:hypothetical protein